MDFNYKPLESNISRSDIINYLKKSKASDFKNFPATYLMMLISFITIGYLPIVSIINRDFEFSFIFALFTVVFALFIAIPGVVAVSILIVRYFKLQVHLNRFADANNLRHTPISTTKTEVGMMFNLGKNPRYDNIIASSLEDQFEIANLRCDISSGRKNQTIERGYIKIKLNRKLPHIVLDSISNNFNLLGLSISNLPVAFKNDQKMSLEGDFNSHFTLYAPEDYKTDALYIFNPALMALFIDKSGDYDAEIIDNFLYIYSSTSFDLSNAKVIKKAFEIINTVMTKTAQGTKRYSDDRVGDFSANRVHLSGLRLKKGLKLGSIVFTVLLILFYLEPLWRVLWLLIFPEIN